MNREFVEYLSQRTNETLAVATILHTAGSTPRKAGTSMVVFPDGSIFGTIGGGRAENEILKVCMRASNCIFVTPYTK